AELPGRVWGLAPLAGVGSAAGKQPPAAASAAADVPYRSSLLWRATASAATPTTGSGRRSATSRSSAPSTGWHPSTRTRRPTTTAKWWRGGWSSTPPPSSGPSGFMAARWELAGNHAELAVYPEAPHGAAGQPTEIGRRVGACITAFLAKAAQG